MIAAVRALLSEAIDYAGLFPPAKLPLAEAIRNYAGYRRDPDAWMLGRFICPASELIALDVYAEECFDTPTPTRFSILSRGGDTAAKFRENFDDDLRSAAEFQQRHGDHVAVEAFEVRLPPDVLRDECTADLVRLMADMRAALAGRGFAHVPLACEAPLLGDRRRLNETAAGGIAFHNSKLALERRGTPADRIALKIRCGGTTADAFPSIEELAFILSVGIEMGLPMKFTAGLHHPLRRFDPGVNTHMHGFVNVFLATLLAVEHDWNVAQIAELLADAQPAGFSFTSDIVAWNGFSAPLDAIGRMRQSGAIAFGSCSFDEPRADLRALGWL